MTELSYGYTKERPVKDDILRDEDIVLSGIAEWFIIIVLIVFCQRRPATLNSLDRFYRL